MSYETEGDWDDSESVEGEANEDSENDDGEDAEEITSDELSDWTS